MTHHTGMPKPKQDAADQPGTGTSSRPDAPHAPQPADTAAPDAARIYDYLLGGSGNVAADRAAAQRLLSLVPDAAAAARQNRAFLRRVVRFLVREAQIRQFIDIGTGLPRDGNAHEVAQEILPDAHVLYVDYDPVVIARAQAMLADNATAVAINRDVRRPQEIIGHPALQALINLDQPVAVLLIAVMHFVTGHDNPYGILDRLKEVMAPGSYLAISHVSAGEASHELAGEINDIYHRAAAPVVPRTRAEVTRFFDGLDILPPGVVNGAVWRAGWAETDSGRAIFYGGLARKL
jgi:trans-aconitate methyltransferase